MLSESQSATVPTVQYLTLKCGTLSHLTISPYKITMRPLYQYRRMATSALRKSVLVYPTYYCTKPYIEIWHTISPYTITLSYTILYYLTYETIIPLPIWTDGYHCPPKASATVPYLLLYQTVLWHITPPYKSTF